MYHYSNRLSWNFEHNEFTRSIEARRRDGGDLLDLTVSNPTDAFDNYPHDETRCSLGAIRNFSYQPEPFGLPAATAAVAQYYGRRDLDVPSNRIVLTASTSEAYSYLFKLFCDPGDEVLIPIPSYPLFEYLARLENVNIVPYRLAYDGSWFIDFDHLVRRLSTKTRAIIVVNPNNPTGSFLKSWETERLAALARERNLPLISDEVFMDYQLQSSARRVLTQVEQADFLSFSLNGLSKAAGMPQMKLGWIVINGPENQVETARRKLELISDTFLSVGTPVQLALPELLRIGETFQHTIRSRVLANLEAAHDMLRQTALHPLHCEGGWSLILQLPATASEAVWVERILDAGVIVQPGYFFDLESEPFIVVSLITPETRFCDGIRVIQELADAA